MVRLGDLLNIALTLGVIAIFVGIMSDVLSNIQSGQTSGSVAYNVTGKGLESMSELSKWLPTIGMVAAAVVLLGFIVGIFAYFRRE